MSILQHRAASGVSSLFQALESNTRTRMYLLVIAGGIVATIVLWVVHLSFPHVVLELLGRDSKFLILCLFAVLFAPPFAVAFSIGAIVGRPADARAEDESGPMSVYFYRERATREWTIAIVAGLFGGLNFLLTVITGESL